MEKLMLDNPKETPTDQVIVKALKRSFPAYRSFIDQITGEPNRLVPEWRYYNDGKSWLCNISCNKKTVCWLSVWEAFFKISFYFTEKTAKGINLLNISDTIKKEFKNSKPIGKLIPLVIHVKYKNQLNDVLTLIQYKLEIK
jgi:hypothetical protein